MLELSEGDPDEWEVDLDQAERENHILQAGDDPGVKEWYNHPAHHYVHRNFMKSADFIELPQGIQQLFEEHDQEHTYYEEQQAMNASQMQGGGQGQPSQNGSTPVQPGANGQQVPEGPPAAFSGMSPANIIGAQPQ